MDVWTVPFFVVGLAALVGGAELLVRGAARLALRTGLSPVVIGLTVVAFGTSAPELAVSLGAAIRDQADLAVGNVVGSNIANVLLVLGVSAMIGGLVVARRLVRIDVPIVIGVSVLLWLFSLNNQLDRWEGIVLFVLLISYISWTVMAQLRAPDDPSVLPEELDDLTPDDLDEQTPLVDIGYVIAGLLLLVVGSSALVEAATDVATALGVSELVVGLTVVAIGTSLPEVATSVLAAVRGERDLAVGNAIGSNLFNILAVLGVTGTVSPSAIPIPDGAVSIDLPVMIAVAVACLPIFATGYYLARWEGAVFLAFYIGYLTWLVLDASDHDLRDTYSDVVIYFAIPLTALTFGISGARYLRRRRTAPAVSQ